MCKDDYMKFNGECLKCASSTWELIRPPLIGLSGIIAAVLLYYGFRYFSLVREFDLSIYNVMRAKVICTLGQLLGLFSQQSANFSWWFKELTKILLRYSMPFDMNPGCLALAVELNDRNLGFLTGWISFLFFWLFITLLLNVHRVKWIRRNVDPSRFEAVQNIASILCSNAIVILQPTFFDFVEVAGRMSEMSDQFNEYWWERGEGENHSITELYLTDIILRLASLFVVQCYFYFFIGYGARMFHKEVKNELDTEDEDSADSSIEEAWRQVDRLIPFYAGFAQQYTPESKDHEQVAYLRRVAIMVFTGSSKVLEKAVLYNGVFMQQFDVYALGNDISESLDIERVYIAIIACLTFFVVLVQTGYLEALIRRPFISPRESREYGDIINDTETVVSRAFVWVSLATVLKMYLPQVLDLQDKKLEKTVTDVICITLLVALVWSHRNLFRSVTATATSEVEGESGSERSRANSSLNTDDASNRIILDMMKSKTEMELIKLKKELSPLIPGMSLRERRRWEAMVQAEETRTGLMRYRSFRVLVRLARILAAGLALSIVVILWAQVIYLAQKHPRVLDGLVVIDVIMVGRFEWKLYRGKCTIDPAVEEDGVETRAGDDDIEMSTITVSDMGTRPGTFSIENPMAEAKSRLGQGRIEMPSTNPLVEVQNDHGDSDDDDEGDEEMGKQAPPTTSQRKKSLVRNPSARTGSGVQNLKKKFEGGVVEEEERAKQQDTSGLGQVVSRKEARL